MKKLIAAVLAGSAMAATMGTSAMAYTIGFEPYTMTNEYFTAVLNGVKQACEETGCELVTYDPQNDPTVQAEQVSTMIHSDKIDALVFLPYDSGSCRTILKELKDNDIYVVNVDAVVTEDNYDLVDAIIATDNIEMGYISGQWVVDNYPEGANIAICHHMKTEACVLRYDGFWKAIKENAKDPDAYVEVQVYDGNGEAETAYSGMTDVLEAYEDIDVIFCANDPMADAVIRACEDAGRLEQISVIGQDGAPVGKQNIEEGKQVQTSAQKPTYMGYHGVMTAIDLLDGKDVTFNTSIAPENITKETIDQYDVNAWDVVE